MKKILVLFFVIGINLFGESIYIGTFNTLHLGWKDKDYELIGRMLGELDLVGLVEVMDPQSVEKIVESIERETGKDYDYIVSQKSVGRGSYKEYYGYVYNRDKVEVVEDIGFYKDESDDFERDPYGVTFKSGEFDFTLVLVHSIFGKSRRERELEGVNLVDVYRYFQELDKDEQDILIGGDFNLPAYDDAYKRLLSEDEIFYTLDPTTKTTIGKNGLASSYDNIFYSYKYTKEYTGRGGVIDFTEGDYKGARKRVSDHLPIFIEVETDRDDD